jgi:hypothetical protein
MVPQLGVLGHMCCLMCSALCDPVYIHIQAFQVSRPCLQVFSRFLTMYTMNTYMLTVWGYIHHACCGMRRWIPSRTHTYMYSPCTESWLCAKSCTAFTKPVKPISLAHNSMYYPFGYVYGTGRAGAVLAWGDVNGEHRWACQHKNHKYRAFTSLASWGGKRYWRVPNEGAHAAFILKWGSVRNHGMNSDICIVRPMAAH